MFSGPFGMQGGQSWNPILFAKGVVRLGVHLKLGLVAFAGIQLGLTLLNKTQEVGPKVSIWNPLVIANPPLLQNAGLNTGGASFFTHEYQVTTGGKDRHKAIAAGTHVEPFQIIFPHPPFLIPNQPVGVIDGPVGAGYQFLFPRLVGAPSQDTSILDTKTSITEIGQPLISTALKTRNFYTDQLKYSDNATFTLGDLITDALAGRENILVEDQILTSPNNKRFKFPSYSSLGSTNGLSKLFSVVTPGGAAYPTEWRPKSNITSRTRVNSGELAKAAFVNGIIPARFKADNDQGFFLTSKKDLPNNKNSGVSDDEAYLPLTFTDIRPVSGDKLRHVMFRPFITDLKESFHPDWNKSHYFGRTDWVAIYQSTGRNISLSFQVHTFAAEDLKVVYNKLNWLTSMVYPKYDSSLSYVAGPVIRLRVGDVISSRSSRGLTGILESLDFDYGGSSWELEEGMKVPKSVKVSLSFVVLHDMPIGIGEGGKFGGIGKIDPATDMYVPPQTSQNTSTAPKTNKDAIVFPNIESSGPDGFRGFPDGFNEYDPITGKSK